MKRLFILTALSVVLTTSLPLGDLRAQTTAAVPDSSWTRIGTLQGDTLFVSLDKVIAAALTHNEMLAASGAMRDAASAEALGAWRGFLPQVQLGEFFMRSDDALSVFGFKLQNRGVTPLDFGITPDGFQSDLINRPGETNNFITRVQLLQPIFNGGMGLYGKQAANAASRAAEFNHARAAETVRFQTIQAFKGLILADAYANVMEAAVASAEGHVQQARSLVANEMATQADLLQAQVYLSGLQQQLIEIRNLKAIAGENIKLLTATRCVWPIATETTFDADDAPAVPASFDPTLASERKDLLARREEAEAAGKMVGVARGAVLPHINLSVQKDWYDLENLFGTNSDSWTLGVFATMGFGVQNVGEIKKAKAQSRAARHMVDFESRRAQVQATEAWLNVSAAHQKVLVAREAVVAARDGLRIVSNQYREGLASMVNLLDTQAATTQAEGNLVQALHDLDVGLANLEYMGAVPSVETAAVDPENTDRPDTARN